MMNRLSISFLLVMLFGCAHSGRKPAASFAERFPEGWVLSEMVAGAVTPDEAVNQSHVLAWQIMEDGRPWRTEACILCLRVTRNRATDLWKLVHVARTPGDEWTPYIVFDAPITSQMAFDHAPTQEEILRFIRGTAWDWDGDEEQIGYVSDDFASGEWKEVAGFRVVDGHVCRATWRELTGKEFAEDVPPVYLK